MRQSNQAAGPVTIEDVKYTGDFKAIVHQATLGERTPKCMVHVADLDLRRGKDPLHEFMRRINEVKAATEKAIVISEAPTRFAVLVVRLPETPSWC